MLNKDQQITTIASELENTKSKDNGCGMSAEECEQILTKDSKGYGEKNVHQRMQLYYGPEYGLTFHSTKGMGTYALLKVRKDINKI